MTHETVTIKYEPIHAGTAQTDIIFYDDVHLEQLGAAAISKNALFITDTQIYDLEPVGSFLNGKQSLVLPSGEAHKTIENALLIVKTAISYGLNRSSVFIGIGGGVICDLTAFASSIFMRGCRLELVPTTLLAMADAAVGGKTGCDFSEYKNMIGSFYPAAAIHIFPDFIQSLPEYEYRSGLAEVIKTALLYAPKLFQIMKDDQEAVLQRDRGLLRQMIKRSVQAKAHIVERDLTEKGLRMQLNLGHTFAHALETICGLGSISHGEAVAWGIARALELSVRRSLCAVEYRDEVFSVLSQYGWCTEPQHPEALAGNGKVDTSNFAHSIVAVMKKDKKNGESALIRLVLQRDIHSTCIEEVAQEDILSVLM